MSTADIRFVHAPDGTRLAYSVTGTGPQVTIKAGMWLSHIDFDSTNPLNRHWRDAMQARGRFMRYDARGSGLSDWSPPAIDFDAWVQDLETIADAVAARDFNLFGYSQGAGVAIAYRQFFTTQFLPAGTREQHQWFNELQRVSASSENAVRCMRVFNAMDVTDLLARGSDNAQIAAHLGVSDKTVRNQVSAILDVLGIESRGHLIVRAR